MSQPSPSNRRLIDRMQLPSLAIGVVAMVVCIIVGTLREQRENFFRAYLFGWLFWLAVSVGSMALASLHYLTGGNWGRLGRGVAESAAKLLPLNAILFIPVLFGLKYIFPWADPEKVKLDSVLIHRMAYMNATWFTIRYAIYFVVWSGLAYMGVATARKYDLDKSEKTYDRLRKIAATYLVFYIALMTLAAVDWIMSREPHWTSSIFGFIICINQTLTALLFVVIMISQLVDRPPLGDFAKPEFYNDLGNLMLTLVILWTYTNFAQFLITWTGNEQEDIGWYIQRTSHGWKAIAGMLIYLHFMVPFLLLLSRDIKRNIKRLAFLAGCLLVMRFLDLFWMMTPAASMVAPSSDEMHPTIAGKAAASMLELLMWIGIGGIYFWAFVGVLNRRPQLLPEPFPEEIDEEKATHGHQATQPG